jgi:hypothetical protein
MKRQIYQRLFVIVGIILLIGLIAGCGGSEPRFKTIDSKEYNIGNRDAIVNALKDNHVRGKTTIDNSRTIMEPYWNDIMPLVRKEMATMSSTAAGMAVVLKVDTYRLIGYFYYENGGAINNYIWLYNY